MHLFLWKSAWTKLRKIFNAKKKANYALPFHKTGLHKGAHAVYIYRPIRDPRRQSIFRDFLLNSIKKPLSLYEWVFSNTSETLSSLGRIQRGRSNILVALEPHWACIPSTSQKADFSSRHCFWFKAFFSRLGSTTPLQNPTLYSVACNLPRTAARGSSLDRKQPWVRILLHDLLQLSISLCFTRNWLGWNEISPQKVPGPFWSFKSILTVPVPIPIPDHSCKGFILPFRCSKN